MSRVQRELLLVEDSPSDVALITSYLDSRVWRIEHAPSRQEAMDALSASSYDAVLLDLGLPDAEGFDTVRDLRDQFAVPIVVLTSRPEARWGTDVLQSGAQDFLSKDEVDGPTLERTLRYAMERHRQVEQLDRAQRRLRRYARAVAHDIRTPLATMRGFAEMIRVEEQSRGAASSRSADYAGRIVDQAKRLLDLAADLLEDSADTGGVVEVDMTSAARWVEEVVGPRLDRSGAQMTITRLPRLRGNKSVLRQVLLNLTTNVLDHARSDNLEMRWSSQRRPDGGWDVILEDNGNAVSDDLLAGGQPLPATEVEATEDGHGIGLRVTAAAVGEHGGEVWLSRGLAGGLRVTLAFPPDASVDPGIVTRG